MFIASTAGVPAPAVFTIDNRDGFFYTVAPCRIVDTRGPLGGLGGPALEAGSLRTLVVTGTCGVPATAKSLSINVTVTNVTAGGYLTLTGGGQAVPLTSTINFSAGQTRANNAIVGLATDGSGTYLVRNGSAGTLDFILDVNGYFR